MRKIVIVLLILSACKIEPNGNKLVVEKNSSGKTLSEINFISDTIKHGLAKYYFEDGKIKEEVSYDHGLLEGSDITFSKQGIIESTVSFKKGKREGVSSSYYSNGILKTRIRWFNDMQFGDSFFYFQNGKLDTYACFDFQEHTRYLITYDSITGSKVSEEGDVLGQVAFKDSVLVNETFHAKYSIAQPPAVDVRFSIRVEHNGIISETKNMVVRDNSVSFEDVFNESGEYKLIGIGELRSKAGVLLKQDSIVQTLHVVN